MQDFIIEVSDRSTSRKDYLVFSTADLFKTREEAGKDHVSPLIVRKIERKAREKGYRIPGEKGRLFRIAREILIEGERLFSIAGKSIDAGMSIEAESPGLSFPNSKRDRREREDIPKDAGLPLVVVHYDDHIQALEQLMQAIREEDRIPVIWNRARGFLLDHLSHNYPLFDGAKTSGLSDPKEVIRFIIQRPQSRVGYILEDFHHFIGGEETVHPGVGEVRSLLKDLYRALEARDERVYLFVPTPYQLPKEMELFFHKRPGAGQKPSGFLNRYGLLLTDENYLARVKPVIGADALIERVIQILVQMETSNPLLVGHPGVGKTAIAEGLAAALLKNAVPVPLRGRMLYSLSLNSLVAGTRYRGDFEERLEGLMEEVRRNSRQIIVFIDEIHTLLDAGSAEGSLGAGEVLKSSLARGEFPCIGATTLSGAEHLARDPALSRRFKKVMVREPTPEQSLKILRGITGCLESHHGLKIEDGALVAAVELSTKHLTEEYLPHKAITLVDGAAAYCSIKGSARVTELDIRMELKRLQRS